MRTLLAILLVTLLVAAPLAIAERGSEKSRADDDHRHRGAEIASNESDDNETEDESEDDADDDANVTHQHRGRDGRADADARRADAEGVKANRSALLDGIVARLHALRASWLENATAIREACHAQTVDENATQEDRTADSHCIRDGYAEWRAERRAEIKELRAELRALFDHRGRGASD